MSSKYRISAQSTGFAACPNMLARCPDLSPGAKALYYLLRTYANQEHSTAWPSTRRLEHELNVNEKTLRKYKAELRKTGWIHEVQTRPQGGQFGLVLITLFFSPTMNPFFTGEVDESTVSQILPDGKNVRTDKNGGRPPYREQEPIKKKQQQDGGGVFSVQLDGKTEKAINWTVDQAIAMGTIKTTPAQYRAALARMAAAGKFDMSAYEDHLARREAEKEISKKVAQEWEEMRKLKEDPKYHEKALKNVIKIRKKLKHGYAKGQEKLDIG